MKYITIRGRRTRIQPESFKFYNKSSPKSGRRKSPIFDSSKKDILGGLTYKWIEVTEKRVCQR